MYTSPDFERIFWEIATQTPMALALLVTGLFLLAKRRVAPRPCTIAAVTFLGLFVFNLMLFFFHEWMREILVQSSSATNSGNTLFSVQKILLLWKLTNVFSVMIHAIGVCILGWCVMMGRKAVGRDD